MAKNVREKYSVIMMWELIFLWEKSLLHGRSETKMETGLRGSSEFLNKEKLSGFQPLVFSLQFITLKY